MNFILVSVNIGAVLVILLQIDGCSGQQEYVNNKQLDCNKNYSNTGGYLCNGAAASCLSYLTFRSNSIYNSPSTIGYLLNSDPYQIAQINNISDVQVLPSDTLLIVPIDCSCNTQYYHHNASYVPVTTYETFFSVSNNTYQGLTTCQSMIAQNYPTHNYTIQHFVVGSKLVIPLHCACPTSNQTDAGFRYLLTYLITWADTTALIANRFESDEQSILEANQLTSDDLIFPFTPILVPLKTRPTKIDTSGSSPPPPPSPPSLDAVSYFILCEGN